MEGEKPEVKAKKGLRRAGIFDNPVLSVDPRNGLPYWPRCPLMRRKERLLIHTQKVVVVMPAYNAETTLVRTYEEVMEQGVVDHVIIVDDSSTDQTEAVARRLPQTTYYRHAQNRGYGANQKTCYRLALDQGAEIIIMVHPDYQYTPKLVPVMAAMIASRLYECVLASRILGGKAIEGGMPAWKYVCNRALTLFENFLTGAKLSEYHSGYRAFSASLLGRLPLEANSDDFVFDNQILAQILWAGGRIGEVSCPTRYSPESSSINFVRSCKYGAGCIQVAFQYRLARWGICRPALFDFPRGGD